MRLILHPKNEISKFVSLDFSAAYCACGAVVVWDSAKVWDRVECSCGIGFEIYPDGSLRSKDGA